MVEKAQQRRTLWKFNSVKENSLKSRMDQIFTDFGDNSDAENDEDTPIEMY